MLDSKTSYRLNSDSSVLALPFLLVVENENIDSEGYGLNFERARLSWGVLCGLTLF